MNPFSYSAATAADEAVQMRGNSPRVAYLGGGTNLLDHLKLGVERPEKLIDVRHTGLNRIEDISGGGVRIGAEVTNTALAYDERIKKRFPVLSEAILSGASPQLRNMATTAGNLLQRTRCYYFRDNVSPCNKREPGSGCAALEGLNRIHALLGTSDRCIATHPSDMDVALVALDAVVQLKSAAGSRSVPLADFYVAYGEDPARENVLQPGEMITAVDLPATPWFARSHYFKARERASYEFALSSVAAVVELEGGRIKDCRLALGGVATKPWRALAAEKVLRGSRPDEAAFLAAADAELKAAQPRTHNKFKVELCRASVVTALQTVVSRA